MTESILLSLLSTISSIIFSSMFQEPKELNIEGAPNWYGEYKDKNHIVAYGYSNLDRDFIQFSKDDCKKNMTKEVALLLNKAISINKMNLDNEFNQLKTNYLNKQNYNYYFDKELNYEKIYHQYNKNETFSKCTLEKNSFIAYQKEILNSFNKNYNSFKMEKRQKELENEVKKL